MRHQDILKTDSNREREIVVNLERKLIGFRLLNYDFTKTSISGPYLKHLCSFAHIN